MAFIIKSEQGYPVKSATLGAVVAGVNATASVQAGPATSVATATSIAAGPIQVTGLTVGLLQVPLSWTAVSGAASYRLYRNGSLIASPSSTSATDALASGTAAIYTVSAVNSGGTEGPRSAGVTVGGSGTSGIRRRIN